MSDAITYSPADTLSRDTARWTQVAARSISDICSPAMLSIPCLFVGVWASDVPGTYRFALLYFLIAIPLPLAYVAWLLKTGRVADFHLPDRRDRTGPFAVSLASALCGIAVLFFFRAPPMLMALVATAFVQTTLLFLITLVWQISVHTATTAGLVTYTILALGSGASVLGLLVPLVAWARVHLGRHTVLQAALGAVLGCAAFVATFALRGIVW